jgi:hypothetical protein
MLGAIPGCGVASASRAVSSCGSVSDLSRFFINLNTCFLFFTGNQASWCGCYIRCGAVEQVFGCDVDEDASVIGVPDPIIE